MKPDFRVVAQPSIYKKWHNTFSNAVAVKYTLYLARPPRPFILDLFYLSKFKAIRANQSINGTSVSSDLTGTRA